MSRKDNNTHLTSGSNFELGAFPYTILHTGYIEKTLTNIKRFIMNVCFLFLKEIVTLARFLEAAFTYAKIGLFWPSSKVNNKDVFNLWMMRNWTLLGQKG